MIISVIIPSYKPQEYIWECLGSLKRQSFNKSQFEIIIVLNGCCEPYKSQIQSYIDKNLQDFNVVFIQTYVGGVSNARNIALDIAKGEYIAFIDDDDYISPSYLEELYVNSSNGTMALSNIIILDDISNKHKFSQLNSIFNNHTIEKQYNYLSVYKYFEVVYIKLIPKEIIGQNRFDSRFKNGEDSLFMFAISKKLKNVKFTSSEAIYYRRMRENSAVTKKQKKRDIIKNSTKLISAYTQIYIKNICQINVIFFIRKIFSTLISMVLSVKKNY